MAKKKGGKKKKSSGTKSEVAASEPPAPGHEDADAPAQDAPQEEQREPELAHAVSEVIGDEPKTGKTEKKFTKKFKTQLAKFTADGHDVSGLEAMLETASTSELKSALKEFEAGIESNDSIRKKLQETDMAGFESEIEALNLLLANPMKHSEAAEAFGELSFKRRSAEIMSALSKMVLPSMKSRVEAMKAMLHSSKDLEAVETEFSNLKRDYKQAYAEEGVKAQVAVSQSAPDAKKARMPMSVKDIFLLYKDGRFISHHTNRLVSKEQQKELFADLKTGRDFLRSPKYLPQKVNVIPGKNRNILVQSGRFTVVIVLAEGSVDPWSENIISKVITLMEKEDQMQLKDWNGDVSALKSSGKYMQALLFAFLKLAKKGKQ